MEFTPSACKRAIFGNEYMDLVVEHSENIPSLKLRYKPACIQLVDDFYAVLNVPIVEPSRVSVTTYGYAAFPNCYTLLDTSNMESSGVLKLRRYPYIDLLGTGVMVGIIDTGVDYTNPLFINPDNTSRISYIWDQTDQSGDGVERFPYGKQYTREDINKALQSGNPLEVVPATDENGHGTFLAGIAAGNIDEQNQFTGVAPFADIAVVKLKEAKQYLKDYYLIEDGVSCYQENDIMTGVKYLTDIAKKEEKPISICIGLGSNQGGHTGSSMLASFLDQLADKIGIGISIAAGNEAGQQHHYEGVVTRADEYEEVELKVEEGTKGFCVELWAGAPNVYSVGFVSPGGEFVPKIPARIKSSTTIPFLLERSTIDVAYEVIESKSGDELIFMRFDKPSPGIWKIRVYREGIGYGNYHMWLPVTGFILPGNVFLKPNPYTTICLAGNATVPITVVAYNHITNSLYLNSSRGYTRDNHIKPELTAPGVDIYGPLLDGKFGTKTGTSVAAAHVTGIVALMFEWGFVQYNDFYMDTNEVKKFLIKGANRSDIEYPNREWGYGTVDIYNTFLSLINTL